MGKRFLGETPAERADNIAWLKRCGGIAVFAIGFACISFFAQNQHLIR